MSNFCAEGGRNTEAGLIVHCFQDSYAGVFLELLDACMFSLLSSAGERPVAVEGSPPL